MVPTAFLSDVRHSRMEKGSWTREATSGLTPYCSFHCIQQTCGLGFIETEIGAALCAMFGTGKTLTFNFWNIVMQYYSLDIEVFHNIVLLNSGGAFEGAELSLTSFSFPLSNSYALLNDCQTMICFPTVVLGNTFARGWSAKSLFQRLKSS